MLFICRDALEDSVIGNVGLAMEAQKAGSDVAVVFTGEALAALAGQALGWSPLFTDRKARITISRNAAAMGIPVAHARDNRWTDLSRLLDAAREAGVMLLACPLWSRVLALDGKLPPQVMEIDMAAWLRELGEAKTIIGGY